MVSIANSVHHSWLDVLTDPVRLAIIQALVEREAGTAADLVRESHASYRAVHRHLDVLVNLGLVRELRGESDGESPGRPASVFSLDPRTRESATALLELLSEPLEPWPRPAPAPTADR